MVNSVNLVAASRWLALMIGNSRLHWALFQDGALAASWDTPHLSSAQIEQLMAQQFAPAAWQALTALPAAIASQSSICADCADPMPLWLASVVPPQTQLWQAYPTVQTVQAHQLPIGGLYATLGCDRILALWGAGQTYGWPVLVVDGGTALTFTAATADVALLGGAITPGLRLQFQALAQQTATLPDAFEPFVQQYLDFAQADAATAIPPRWATDTSAAIQSGIVYLLLAGVQDYVQAWWAQYPTAAVVMTGGDGQFLWEQLRSRFPTRHPQLHWDTALIFKGIQAYRAWSQA